MTRTELIDYLAMQQPQLQIKDIKLAVKLLLAGMVDALIKGQRIEIRGLGSFSLRYRAPRIARNPKTGDLLKMEGKSVVHFKAGKDLRERMNEKFLEA